jgi:hypothetical protein
MNLHLITQRPLEEYCLLGCDAVEKVMGVWEEIIASVFRAAKAALSSLPAWLTIRN